MWLELKVIADVCLVGLPSVGKSTLLSVVTKAKPKIAAYAFTTLTPNLGMVVLPDGRDFSMADLPGLIKGASKGVGLGLQFLRHIERTKVILHLVSMDPSNGRDPFDDYQTIRHELAAYREDLSNKKSLIVATQMDIPGSQEKLETFEKKLPKGIKLYPISSVKHEGLNQLLSATADLITQVEQQKPAASSATLENQEKEYQFKPTWDKHFTVEATGSHSFILSGEYLEHLVQRTNLEHQDGIMQLARKLKRLGVDEALLAKGAQDGDEVTVGKLTFEFVQ